MFLGDATDAVKAEFRKIEHESQVFDPRAEQKKAREPKEDSPGKRAKDQERKKPDSKKRRLPPK